LTPRFGARLLPRLGEGKRDEPRPGASRRTRGRTHLDHRTSQAARTDDDHRDPDPVWWRSHHQPRVRHPRNEDERQPLNQWIRASPELGAVADLDRALHDPVVPANLLPNYDSEGRNRQQGISTVGSAITQLSCLDGLGGV
jgi:hypothetical protein